MSLASRIKSLLGQKEHERDVLTRLLNEAMAAYVHTIPSEQRLRDYLEEAGRSLHFPEVEATLREAMEAAESYLYAQPNGVCWTGDFEQELFRQVRQACPWIDEVGFRALKSFAQWLCWHEGLNAPEA